MFPFSYVIVGSKPVKSGSTCKKQKEQDKCEAWSTWTK